jgi:outer membrane protein assembly factor BamB
MLALLLMGVNASACVPRVVRGPETDPGGWRRLLGSGTRAPSADETVPPDPSRWWQAGLGHAASGPPAVGDQVVAALSVNRDFLVLQWETGRRIWGKRLSAPGAGSPLIAGDRVFAATAGQSAMVYAYRLADGKRLWRRKVGPVVGPITTIEGLVVAATDGGHVVALTQHGGEQRWSRPLHGPVRSGVTALADGLLVATDDSLFVLSPADGSIRARRATPGAILAPPAWSGDTVVLASPDGFLMGVRTDSLGVLWSLRTGEAIFGGAAIARDTAFAVTVGGWLWRVPLDDPYARTRDSLGVAVRARPAPVAEGVLVGGLNGEILLVGRDSVARITRLRGPIEQPPIVRHGMMLLIDGNGTIEAWR